MCIVNGCCEGGATFESMISNARDAVRDSNRGEGGATIESIISNARYAIWDSDRGEGGATIESPISSNARYAVGDNGILTTCYKYVCCRFNNRITIITAIINCISAINDYGSKGGATNESLSNALYFVSNSNRGK